MAETMTPDRFRSLVEAYGGALDRWPEASRPAATILAMESWARELLDDATHLDAHLDTWPQPAIDHALATRIAASAPVARKRLRASPRLWWSGLGLAAALAGTAAGSAGAAAFAPIQVLAEPATAFGDLGQEPLS